MQIRKALPDDINELRELYYGTITTINSKDYNEEQIKVWAATSDRTEGFLKRIQEQYFFIAENQERAYIAASHRGVRMTFS